MGWKLALVLSLLDSAPKSVFYLARLAKYYEVDDVQVVLFKVWTAFGGLCPIIGLFAITKALIFTTGQDFSTALPFTRETAICVGAFSQIYALFSFSQSLKGARVQQREAARALKEKQRKYAKGKSNGGSIGGGSSF